MYSLVVTVGANSAAKSGTNQFAFRLPMAADTGVNLVPVFDGVTV